jgi:hypothetical protein
MQDSTLEIKSRIVMVKAASNKKKALLTNKWYPNLRKKLENATIGAQIFMVPKLGHFGTYPLSY